MKTMVKSVLFFLLCDYKWRLKLKIIKIKKNQVLFVLWYCKNRKSTWLYFTSQSQFLLIWIKVEKWNSWRTNRFKFKILNRFSFIEKYGRKLWSFRSRGRNWGTSYSRRSITSINCILLRLSCFFIIKNKKWWIVNSIWFINLLC